MSRASTWDKLGTVSTKVLGLRIDRAGINEARPIAAVHCAAALAGYATIFPSESPKPTPESLIPEWVELLREPSTTVLHAHSSETVGCVVLRPDSSVPARFLLSRLYVRPTWWGRGVGARLHDAAVETARNVGATRLNLWVLEANTRARAMYERRGWTLVPGRTLPNDTPGILDVMYDLAVD